MSAVIPRATYRLQLHHGFDFDAACAVLPYLQRLGISHVYCSPITQARPGSLHGYDVVDPGRISDELGGRAGFERLAQTARGRGMGLLIDQVPNHMGVFGADNPWWLDVLENGESSPYANWFDIDWQPPNRALTGKLLVPVLGDHYGAVLDRGELRLVFEPAAGRFHFQYHEHRFPLAPRSYALLLGARPDLADAFGTLRGEPPRLLQQRLAAAVASDPALAAAVDAAVERHNAASERDALDALHEQQAYRLAFWRVAADEINYRRFFDVNSLAALRIEDEAVFEAVQGLGLDLAAAGLVDGLRIDHPDGLHDPAAYFDRLQRGYARRAGLAEPAPAGGRERPQRPLYVVAEKIAAGHEEVPRDWALHGTTGYRFAMVLNGLFVERESAARMERIWRADSGVDEAYEEMVHAGKRQTAQGALAAELLVLANALQRIARVDRHTRDFTLASLRGALAEVAACMPVYRTYVAATVSAQDRRFVDWAIAQARRRSADIEPAIFDFVRRCLLLEPHGAQAGDAMRRFAMRFQQFCAPVAAKGVEDTAFYRYHRLVSLNEVGGDPAVFGLSARAFHAASADRAAHWPHTLLATSTHDNKRAEDVRQRINVLSERPAGWRLALRRWRGLCRKGRSRALDDGVSAADRHLFWQTVLGTLPAGGLAGDDADAYRERIGAYMQKAAREAKVHTSWMRPDADYEKALARFVAAVLGQVAGNALLADLQQLATELAWFGALNSTSASVLKFASPGVPDIYQGTELIDLSLVDPDNRRPVDFALRAAQLAQFERMAGESDLTASLTGLLAAATDGRLKLWVIWRLLRLRATEPALFQDGGYVPLAVKGERRANALAFARRSAQGSLLVVAARKFTQLASAQQLPTGPTIWGDTSLGRPKWLTAASGIDVLTGRPVSLAASLDLAALLDVLPVAVVRLD